MSIAMGRISHHSIANGLVSHAGYANVHDLSKVGAHPRRWLEMLMSWESQNPHYAVPKSGKPGEPPYFGSDFVVVVMDAHNGLQMKNNTYTVFQYQCSSV